MKTARPLSLLSLLLLAAACAYNPHPRTPAPPTAMSQLSRRAPDAHWEPKSEVSADFDGDGVADFALRGLRADRVVVGIVQGPLRADSPTWLLEFPWGRGTEDSLCSRRAKIEIEETDAPRHAAAHKPGKPARPVKGIALYDDRCDSFHIYWSAEKGKFDWWRL